MSGVGQEAKGEILSYLIEPEGIWSSDVMCLDLKTAPDWSDIPSHRPRSLPKALERQHMGGKHNTASGRERLALRPHTNSYSCFAISAHLLQLKLTFKCFLDKPTSCKKSRCICSDIRSKCSECWWDSHAEQAASLISHQDGHERWYISNSKQVELFSLMWLPCIMKYFLSLSHVAVVWKALGLKRGHLQSCHLGSTCFRNRRWRSSLHSTHSNTVQSTRRHEALEISFVSWSHWGIKKAQWGNLIHRGSGNCQAWECAPVMN